MPWTESRSRDEWLAEVQLRGGRLRRRRRVAAGCMGALALVLPVSALVSFTGEPDRNVRLTATGPAPVASDAQEPYVVGPGAGAGAATAVAPAEPGGAAAAPAANSPGPSAGVTPPTAEVHGRVATINGRTEPASPTSRVPVDDPVVRVPASPPPSQSTLPPPPPPSTGGPSSSAGAPVTPAPPGPDQPAVPACPPEGVRVVVATEQSSYAPGQTVRWTSTLENRSAAACLLPSRAYFRVENAAGKVVGAFVTTADYRMPVKAEPGKVFTSSGSWDQKDCSGSACVQVPAGTYVVAADWTEGGSFTARGSFQIVG